LYQTQVRGTKVPPKTQGTYGSPETPPLKSGEPRFPLKPPPFMMYLILIIRLTSSCFLLREGFQGNRRFPELILYFEYITLVISMTLELKKFDMRSITFKPDENKGPVIVMIGRRDTGKSYLIRDLLFYHQDIPIGTVISGTEAGNGFFSAHVPKLFIHEEYNTVLIENILRRQKVVLKQVNKEIEMYRKTTIDPRTFVILDDCLYDQSWTRDKMMRLLFMNGRHCLF